MQAMHSRIYGRPRPSVDAEKMAGGPSVDPLPGPTVGPEQVASPEDFSFLYSVNLGSVPQVAYFCQLMVGGVAIWCRCASRLLWPSGTEKTALVAKHDHTCIH